MSNILVDLSYLDENTNTAIKSARPDLDLAVKNLVNKKCKGAEFTGWVDFPTQHGFALAKHIKSTIDNLDVEFDAVVVIGIGGSYLGTRAVSAALGNEYQVLTGGKKPIFFAGQHLSSKSTQQLLDVLKAYKPIVNVISKSGTTTEPAIAFRLVRAAMEARFGVAEANARIIATTDPLGGALRKLATQKNWLNFEVPADVGGRFSVLTAVGLVPLGLAGFDISALLDGADNEFKSFSKLGADYSGSQYAAARHQLYRSGKVIELFAYLEPGLSYLVEWCKQLFGESEGKEGQGLFPAGLAYTTDLHSLGQIVQEGKRNIFETFLSFAEDKDGLRVPTLSDNSDELMYIEGKLIDEVNSAAFAATKIAHVDGGVPCVGLRAPKLNEYSLGSIFAFFEITCALTAGIMGVNAFNQPGVEAYKKNLFGLLNKPGFETLGTGLRERLKL